MTWTPEERALLDRLINDSPPLTSAQVSKISAITGLIPMNVDVGPHGELGSSVSGSSERVDNDSAA